MVSRTSWYQPPCPRNPFLQDWAGVSGPVINLRINSPGWTTVTAVASRGDLPDSLPATAYFFVNRSASCTAAVTTLDAPVWTSEAQPYYSSDPDDIALSDPSGASAAKDWAGWVPYAGIVCLGGDGTKLYYTCDASGTASAPVAAPAGFSCFKGSLGPEVAADFVTNKCFQTANPAFLTGQGATAQTCPAGSGCTGFGCVPSSTPLPAPTAIPAPQCPAAASGAAAVAVSLNSVSPLTVSGCSVAAAVSGYAVGFSHPTSGAPVSCTYCITAGQRSSGVVVSARRSSPLML